MAEVDFARRFGGVSRLYGEQGLARLQAAHAVVIGLGGVGSWVAEALARNAIGRLTLIDLDNVAESNFNRQIQAIESNEGKPKVSAMAERVMAINPACLVREVDDFVTPENVEQVLAAGADVVLDCTDDAKAKEALAAYCKQQKVVLIMSGSAGGRLDPTRMQVADLANVNGDKLLAKVRNQLRRHHGFPKAATKSKKASKFGIRCVFSNEPPMSPADVCDTTETAVTGLNCAGYGSSISVTGSFGFAIAQLALNNII